MTPHIPRKQTTTSERRPVRPSPVLRARIKNRVCELSFQQAFAYGHRLLQQQRYDPATRIFSKLAAVKNREPRAYIILAICQAKLSDYRLARETLDAGFSNHDSQLASEVHDVMVMAQLGFHRDAMKGLADLVNKHKTLPTLCLWLGDMFECRHKTEKARKCWHLAVKRDPLDGAVALTAREQLRRTRSA